MLEEAVSESHKTVSRARRPEHVPALDGVRGLAIVMVLAHHFLQANNSTGNVIFDFLSAVRASLWVGVDLFFALSGFLITGILFDSLHEHGYFRNFYARRVLRIFPLYYGVLLTLICLTYPLHLQWHGKQYILLTYTQNLGIFTKDYMGFTPASFINLNHFWSLAVEEQFYLVWPLIIFLVRDSRKLLFVSLGLSAFALILRLIMAANGASPTALYEFTLCRMDALLLGGTLALLYRSQWRQIVLRLSIPAFVLLLVLLADIAFHFDGLAWEPRFVGTFGFTLTALASSCLIATTLHGAAWTKFLFENKGMRFFGKYSYGIYVFHYPIDVAITTPLRPWLFATFHSHALAVGLASLPSLLATLAVAFASYQLYEKRFLRLKRYFEPKSECLASHQ